MIAMCIVVVPDMQKCRIFNAIFTANIQLISNYLKNFIQHCMQAKKRCALVMYDNKVCGVVVELLWDGDLVNFDDS